MKKIIATLLLTTFSAHADMNDEPLLFSFAAEELEYRRGTGDGVVTWDAKAWLGTTRDRVFLRSEGEADSDEIEELETTLVWSHAVSPFWNLNLGWRGDWQPERRRNWFAAEMEGLAPGFIETRLSVLAGSRGRWAARLELETEWKLSRTWELKPSLEMDWRDEADPANGLGDGLTETELGLRLHYKIRPDLSPYLGYSVTRLSGETARNARVAGQRGRKREVVAGLSFWF
ncbi:MAG: copper resistance protein B [Gammaproteobacteria bacterium]|nr:copper resistance protein B [Gammaproteobacteria bacterium]